MAEPTPTPNPFPDVSKYVDRLRGDLATPASSLSPDTDSRYFGGDLTERSVQDANTIAVDTASKPAPQVNPSNVTAKIVPKSIDSATPAKAWVSQTSQVINNKLAQDQKLKVEPTVGAYEQSVSEDKPRAVEMQGAFGSGVMELYNKTRNDRVMGIGWENKDPESVRAIAGDTPAFNRAFAKAIQEFQAKGISEISDKNSLAYKHVNDPDWMKVRGAVLAEEYYKALKEGVDNEWLLNMGATSYEDSLAFERYVSTEEGVGSRKSAVRGTNWLDWVYENGTGLVHGGWDAIRTHVFNGGIAKVQGVMESQTRSLNTEIRKNERVRTAWESNLKLLADNVAETGTVYGKNYTEAERDVVLKIAEEYHNNFDQYTVDTLKPDSEINKLRSTLGGVALMDLALRINHSIYHPKSNPKGIRARGDEIDLDNPHSADEPMSVEYLDLSKLNKDGKLDWNSGVSNETFVISSGGMGMEGFGGEINLPNFEAYSPNTKRDSNIKEQDVTGKINPVQFFVDNKMRGAFIDSTTVSSGSVRALAGQAYNNYVSPFEQIPIQGANLSGAFYYNSKPDSFFSHLKNTIAMRNTPEERVAFLMASAVASMKERSEAQGDYHPIVETLGALGATEFRDAAAKEMIDYGYGTETSATRAMFKVHPSMFLGEVAARGATAIRGASMFKGMSKAGWLTEAQIEKIVKFTSKSADWAMAGPVRAVGFVVGYAGRGLVLSGGTVLMGVSKIIGRSAYSLGMAATEASATMAVKNTLKMIGVTDAFIVGGVGRKLAMAWGLGKLAESGGFLTGKYWRLGGYGFRGAMATAAADSTLPNLARRVAATMADKGLVTAPAWDILKGAVGGAGVTFSLGFMRGDLRDGMYAIGSGIGMGGASAGMHGLDAYWTGSAHSTIARQMIEADTTMLDPVLKAKLLHTLNENERVGNWDFATSLIGAKARINSVGGQLVLADENSIASNPKLRNDLLTLADLDYVVGGKRFQVRELKQAAQGLRQTIEGIRNDTTLTEQEKNDKIKVHRESLVKTEMEYNMEVTDYLNAVDNSGDEALIQRVDKGRVSARGVHLVDEDGQMFVFLNLDQMNATTSNHETYHAVKKAISKYVVGKHIVTTMFGVQLRGRDSNGNPSEATFQKGLFDAEDIKEFAKLYYTNAYSHDPATRDAKIAEINSAAQEMIRAERDSTGVISDVAAQRLRKMAEEFGASWFEQFMKRKPLDALYRANKYGKLQTVINRAEMYLKHNTILDANADGIKTNLRREAAKTPKQQATIERLKQIHVEFSENMDAYDKAKEAGATADELKVFEETANKLQAENNKLKGDKDNFGDIDSIFYDSNGNHLIVPDMERHLNEVLGTEGDNRGNLSMSMDMSGMSGSILDGHLRSLGLEHWGYLDKDGVLRLKDKEQIREEGVKRGEKVFEEVGKMDPAVSGVVIAPDHLGNLRMNGMLSDQALSILAGLTIDIGGNQEPLMPQSEVIKYQTIRDAVRNGFNDIGSTKDNNVMQCLYSALSKEEFASDGTVVTSRRPRNAVEQTFRRLVPYRLEFVMTTKDMDGNKVKPHFQAMVTGLDLNVLYNRVADHFGKTYTMPDGTVVKVSDVFGDIQGLKDSLNIYLNNLTNNNPTPSAEIFGGGTMGAAKRDIMHMILGTIPNGGMDMNGKTIYKNNPMIAPFQVAERGPNFVFTTFRLDLMSNLEQLNQRIAFTEDTHTRSQINYQPPSEQGTVIARGVNGDIKTTKLKGSFELKKEGVYETEFDIVEAAGRFNVRSPHLNPDEQISFGTRKQALDYVNLTHNILQAKLTGTLNSTINYKLNGYVVSNIDNQYVILDGFGGNRKSNRASFKQVGTRTYASYDEAMRVAARMHNEKVSANLAANTNIPENVKKILQRQITGLSSSSPEALPTRADVDANGNVSYEQVKTASDEPVFYKKEDPMVVAGLAREGDPVYKIDIQKVDYNLTKTLTGRDNLPQSDPLVKRAASKMKKHLVQFILNSVNNPDIAKGYSWYRDFSERGYQVFGSMFPLFCEALGATSSRTGVDSNFEQAMEFLRLFSVGHYDGKINTIVDRLNQLHNEIHIPLNEGETRNQWEMRHIQRLKSASAFTKIKSQFKLGDEFKLKDFKANDPRIPKAVLDAYNAEYTRALEAKGLSGLTDIERENAIDIDEKAILGAEDTLLFKADGSKYNMNTAKVTMVAVGKFFEKSEGPKTPQFARNLMGRNMDATIDVWAMRTLHRIANSLVQKNNMWRIPAVQETGVKGLYKNLGTQEMPKMVGHGDFFLGQETFKQALAELRNQHGTKFDGKFRDMTAADLQALAWFAEKNLYEQNGWTDTLGAQKSSFEDPLYRVSGEIDPMHEERFSNIRRLLVGVSAENNTIRTIESSRGPRDEVIRIRSSAVPIHVTDALRSQLRDRWGKALIGLNIKPTLSMYQKTTEFSIHAESSLEIGNNITLQNQMADVRNSIVNAKNLLREYAKRKADYNNRTDVEAADIQKKIEKNIASKTKELAELENQQADLQNQFKSDNSAPIYQNHFPALIETIINYGRKYQQESVLAHEVVGVNHPNARPARQIWFKKVLTGFEAQKISKRITKLEKYYGYSLIPDPANPNQSLIDLKSRSIDKLQNDMRSETINQKQKAAMQRQVAALTKEVIGLMRFTGMYHVCVPEFAGVANGEEARANMSEYETKMDDILSRVVAKDKNVLKIEKFHTNTVAVNTGGYDTTNIAETGKEANLDFHIQRYNNSYERYEQQKQQLKSERETGNLTGSVWSPTATERGSILEGPKPSGTDGFRQEGSGSTALGRLSTEDARNWLTTRKSRTLTTNGGVTYGDKDLQVTQLSGDNGKLTNRYLVHDKEARKTMEFKGQEQAEKYVLDRLTGSAMPDSGPRVIERGGKIFEAVEAAVAIPTRKGLPANEAQGIYPAGHPVYDYQPTPSERRRLERITPEEKKAYDEAMAMANNGDTEQARANGYFNAQRIVERISKRLGFKTYYRGTAGLTTGLRSFSEGRENRWETGTSNHNAYRVDRNGITRRYDDQPIRNEYWTGPVKAWLTDSKLTAMGFAAVTAQEARDNGYTTPAKSGRVDTYGVKGNVFDPRNPDHVEQIKKAIEKWTPSSLRKMVDKIRGGSDKEWMLNLYESKSDPLGTVGRAEHDPFTEGEWGKSIGYEIKQMEEAGIPVTKEKIIELIRKEMLSNLDGIVSDGNYGYYEADPTHNRRFALGKLIKEAGFDGYLEKEDYRSLDSYPAGSKDPLRNLAITNPKSVKSLNTVTYDKEGKPVPIEQRFDTSIDDINYQPLRGLVRENESPLSGKKIVLDETIGGRINLLHHKVLTLPKDKNKGMPLVMRMLRPESSWSRNKEYAPVFGDIDTFITTYENLTGKDFYKSFRDIQINRGVGLLDVRGGVLPSMVHEVATKLFEHLSTRLKADPKNRISNDTPENQQWIEGTLIPTIEYLANRSIRNDLKLNDGLTEPKVVDAIRNILMGDMTKAGVSEGTKSAFDEQIQNAFDLFDKRGDRYDRWKRKFASKEEANVSLAKTFEAIKQIDPKIYSLIQLSGLVEKYDIRSGNDWETRNSQVNLENLQAASSEIQLTSTSSTLHSHMLKELMAKHGVDLTESEKKILDISGWSRTKGHAPEVWAGATDSLEASSTNFNPDLNKDYLKKLYEEGYIKEEHYASLLSLHETNPNLDLGITSRSANATTALLGFIQGLSNQRLSLTSGKRSELDNGSFPPDNWAEWARYHGGGDFGIQSEKDFNKVVRDLTSLKDKLTEIYNGKGKVVEKKRLPYNEVIKNRIASGELKTMGETFEELRSYGINKISVVQMMKLAKLTTDTLPINLEALDTDVANTAQSDRTDFQLLSLVHAFSGLNFERHDNTVWAATEGSRGWARSERESIVQNPNEYLMKTDGDSRTMLEELHHSLMGQNRFYKMLNSVEHISHGSGAEFRTAFEKRIAELESELEGRKNDLLLRDNPNANESSIIGTDRRNIRDTDKNNNTNFGEDIDRLEQASQIIGDTALLTIAKLYIKSFDTNLSNFGFSGTVGETGNPNNEPASAHTFSNVPRSVKIPSAKDARFLGEYRWYKDKTLLSKRDYGFKNLIEFAAHALNDRHVQSVLLQMEPVTVNGEEPVNKIIKDLGTSNNPKVKSYAESLRSMFAKATNALQQVYLVLKQLVRFRQSSNHSNQGAFSMKSGNDTYAQKFAADNAETLKTKRTALEQAIEAGALVRPRFHESRLDLVGGQNKPLAKGLDIRNQMNYGNHLDYLGRVQKGESK